MIYEFIVIAKRTKEYSINVDLETIVESEKDAENKKLLENIDKFKKLEKSSIIKIITEYEIKRNKTIKLMKSVKNILMIGFLPLFVANISMVIYNLIMIYVNKLSYDLCILII